MAPNGEQPAGVAGANRGPATALPPPPALQPAPVVPGPVPAAKPPSFAKVFDVGRNIAWDSRVGILANVAKELHKQPGTSKYLGVSPLVLAEQQRAAEQAGVDAGAEKVIVPAQVVTTQLVQQWKAKGDENYRMARWLAQIQNGDVWNALIVAIGAGTPFNFKHLVSAVPPSLATCTSMFDTHVSTHVS
jgi:hypothetical protein